MERPTEGTSPDDGRQIKEEYNLMNFNFFSWIRDGVRQSVLLGVHDAVEHLGPRPDEDPIGQRLMGFLQSDVAATQPKRITGNASRKKLGRSLKEIQADAGRAS